MDIYKGALSQSQPQHFRSVGDNNVSTPSNTTLWRNMHRIEKLIERAKESIKQCKQEKAELRQDLAIMETQLKLQIKDNTATLVPELDMKVKDLRENISLELNDNQLLKAQITKMKKQNTLLEKLVSKYEARLLQLETIIGK